MSNLLNLMLRLAHVPQDVFCYGLPAKRLENMLASAYPEPEVQPEGSRQLRFYSETHHP